MSDLSSLSDQELLDSIAQHPALNATAPPPTTDSGNADSNNSGFFGSNEDDLATAVGLKAKDIGNSLKDSVRGVTAGATFNQADRARAGIDTVLGDDSYGSNLDQERAATSEAKERSPTSYALGNAAGLILSPVNKAVGKVADTIFPAVKSGIGGLLSRYANYGTQGAAVGGMAGAGYSDAPDAAGVARDAEHGAALGGATAVGVPLLLDAGLGAAGKVLPNAGSYSNPEDAAAARALKASGLTPDQIAAKIAARGPQATIADASPGLRDFADVEASEPGATRNAAALNLTQRQGGMFGSTSQGARLSQSLDENLTPSDYFEMESALKSSRSTAANPLYSKLRSTFPEIQSPQLDEATALPSVKSAWANTQEAQPEVAYLQKYGPQTGASPQQITTGPNSIDQWDLTLRNMYDQADALRNSRGQLTGAGQRQMDIWKNLQAHVDDLTSDPQTGVSMYKSARDAWATPSRQLDALDAGTKLIQKGNDDLPSGAFAQMSPEAQEAYRTGVKQSLQTNLLAAPDAADKTKQLFGNQLMRNKLQAVFPSRANFNQFRSDTLAESDMAKTGKQVLGNSSTAFRNAGQEQGEGLSPLEVIESVKEPVAGAANFISKAAGKFTGPSEESTAASAPIFARGNTPQGQAAQQEFLDRMRNVQSRGNIYGQTGRGWVNPRLFPLAQSALNMGGSNQ